MTAGRDAAAEAHRAGLERGELWLQRCRGCGRVQHYPRTACRSCGATSLGLQRAAGRGTVHAAAEVHRPPDPENGREPYLLVLVELAEGPRLLTHLLVDPRGHPGRDWVGTPVVLEVGRVVPGGPLVPLARA